MDDRVVSVAVAAVAALALVVAAGSLGAVLGDGPVGSPDGASEGGDVSRLPEIESPVSGGVGGVAVGVALGGVRAAVGGLVPALPAEALAALALLGVALAALLWRRASRGSVAGVDPSATGTDGVEPDAAGGDRWTPEIDQPPAANPVYAAWSRVVDQLDVTDAETLTPGEYARVARDRGLDRVAVDELTGIFDRVRYGAAAVTDERADRARSAAERACEPVEGASAEGPAVDEASAVDESPFDDGLPSDGASADGEGRS